MISRRKQKGSTETTKNQTLFLLQAGLKSARHWKHASCPNDSNEMETTSANPPYTGESD
jgi:hypothetical protein